MGNRMLKYLSFVVSIGIVLFTSGISGCLPDPCSVGEPDSLFSEYVLIWDLVDSHYACFFARENVNWDQVYEKFRPAAMNLGSRDELMDLSLQLLAELEDPNLSLWDSAGTRLESWNQGAFINWDLSVWQDYIRYLARLSSVPQLDAYGVLKIYPTPTDTLGYIYISDLSSGEFSWLGFFDATYVIRKCSALIIDLRMCGGGGSAVEAFYTSGRFIAELGLGYYRSFRVGPGRNDMGEMQEVLAYRNGAWQFTDPIVLLTGRKTQGAAEQLVLLLRTQSHITVIGDTTAGFANPVVSFNLTEGCRMEIPEMVTYSSDSILILNSGLAPDIYITVSEADFAAGVDPVLDAALEMITP